MTSSRIEHVTCLGCGCACDDLTVTVSDGKIVETTPACPLGRAWFGDGQVPSRVLHEGRPVSLDEALLQAATLLVEARGRCLVYLAADLSSQAQRMALAIADLLRGTVDTATSSTAASGLLAAQRRGRAGATLGEVRNRADVLLFWGVDPAEHYPRYLARYAVEPVGTHVPGGRTGRLVISVSIGTERALRDADLNLTLDPAEEITALSLMRASVLGHSLPEISPKMAEAVGIATQLVGARYAVLVHDGEATGETGDPLRAEALIALAQALNHSTRAAVSTLRAGGNRVGAEAVLTWQTGFPLAVDYSRGFPRYTPDQRGLDRAGRGAFVAALVVGSPGLPHSAGGSLSRLSSIAIGPRASQAGFETRVAIDTGIAGIHENGTAYRMDEVPLRLRPPLAGGRSTLDTLRALASAVRSELERSPR